MKVETVGKLLIATGALVFVYAMTMSVSVGDSGFANIGLLAARQNTLIFGGFLFLAGVILYAVFKLKQTKEDVDIADKLRHDRTEAAKSFMTGADQGSSSIAVRLILGIAFGGYSVLLLTQFVLLIVQMSTESFAPGYVERIAMGVAVLAFTSYAFRAISIKKALIHFVILAAFATASIPVRSMLMVMESRACDDFITAIRTGGAHSTGLPPVRLFGKMAYCAALGARSME